MTALSPWLVFGGRRGWRIRLEFKPADLWIGAFWRYDNSKILLKTFDLYICLLPMLPIHLAGDWLT